MKKKKVSIISLIILILVITSFICLGYSRIISSKYNVLLNRQIIWNVIGLIIMFIVIINNKYIFKYTKIIYLISIILLIIPLLFSSSVNGIKAWISFGFVSFQPSEFMKLSLSLMLANYLSKSKRSGLVKIIIAIILTLIPSILVFLEPDTGSIIIYFFILLFILFFNDINKKYFIFLFIIMLILLTIFVLAYNINMDLIIRIFGSNIFYRVDRIINFTNKSNMQLNNALASIGASGVFGHGFKNSILYFPEAPTDFVFSLLISLFGYIYGLIIIILFFLLDILILSIIRKEKSNKFRLLLIGLYGAFIYQQIQNILMNIGLLPIIGITLPFLSYGGSSLIVYYVFIGLVLKSYLNHNYL